MIQQGSLVRLSHPEYRRRKKPVGVIAVESDLACYIIPRYSYSWWETQGDLEEV